MKRMVKYISMMLALVNILGAVYAGSALSGTVGYASDVKGELEIQVGFDNEYITSGENTYRAWGESKALNSSEIMLIGAVYEDNRLTAVKMGDKHTVAAGESFSFSDSIDIDTVNPLSTQLKVMVWDSINNMCPRIVTLRPEGIGFSFVLEEAAATSAGVYDTEGRLVRTLWSNEQKAAGTHTAVWDGLDDNKLRATDGRYTIKVLSNNVSYELVSMVGNNSNWQESATVLNGMTFFGDFAYYDGKMYYTQPYKEMTKTALSCFNTADPHTDLKSNRVGSEYLIARRVTTDGEKVYYAQTIPGDTCSYVYAYNIATKAEHNFSYGQAGYTHHSNPIQVLNYAIDVHTHTPCDNTGGIDVQKNGSLLFHSYLNSGIGDSTQGAVMVNDKNTGERLSDTPFNTPAAVAADDSGVYVAYKNSNGQFQISRYNVSAAGELSIDRTMPQLFEDVRDISISPDGTMLAVCDAGNTNKIFCIDLSNDTELWTYGSGESYADDPTVKDDKFMFRIVDHNYDETFVTWENDGTVWFGDTGNNRAIRLDVNGTAPEQTDVLSFMPLCHSASVDLNSPERVFTGMQEFEIDYTQTDYNKAWRLVKNWKQIARASDVGYSGQGQMANIMTLSNGRTYCKFYDSSANTRVLYEMGDNYLRSTGTDLGTWELLRDGSIAARKETFSGTQRYLSFVKRELTGFDENNNPVWDAEKTVASLAVGEYDPKRGGKMSVLPVTDSGVLVSFNLKSETDDYEDKPIMHLGAINLNGNTNEWMWKTAPQGSLNYQGEFPTDGVFEVGNSTLNAGGDVKVFGNNVIFQHRGEFYRSGQTNKLYHYNDNGLMIGCFGGAYAPKTAYGETADNNNLVAGNAFDFYYVQPTENSDEAFMLQNDESRKSGMWMWKITGLDSVQEQSIDVLLNSQLRPGLEWTYFADGICASTDVERKGRTDTASARTYFKTTNGVEVDLNDDFVLRYEGYVVFLPKSRYLTVDTKSTARVVINGNEYINGTGSINANISALEPGKVYPITMEFCKNGEEYSNPRVLLKNTSGGLFSATKDLIFYRPNDNYTPDNIKTYDLLEGLPFDNQLSGSIMGWDIPVSTVHAQTGTTTNVVNDGFFEKRDINIKLYSQWNNTATDSEYAVTRRLADAGEGIRKWTLDSKIMTVGRLNHGTIGAEGESSGSHFDILDENGKVISRFCWGIGWKSYANGRELFTSEVSTTSSDARTDRVERNKYHEFSTPNDLTISADETGITFSYCGSTVKADVFEAGADWSKPAKIRVSEFMTSHITNNVVIFEVNFSKLDYTMEYSAT